MQVKEIIRGKLAYATPDTTIRDAANIMRTQNIGSLPILENGKGIGFVTDRDITIRAVAQGLDPDTPIRQVMSQNCISCEEDASLENAVQLMDRQHVRRLLVTDKKQKRPLGVVSLADIAANSSKPDTVLNAVKHIKTYERSARSM